jgi:hypothetical protein
MEKSLNTLAELQAEIGVLQIRRFDQERVLKQKFDGPLATLKSIASLLKPAPGHKSSLSGQDMVTAVSRLILPILLNTSIFRHSGLITKAVVALFSQKAAKNINADTVLGVVDKVKNMLIGNKERKKKPAIRDYGIPPDSETY